MQSVTQAIRPAPAAPATLEALSLMRRTTARATWAAASTSPPAQMVP